MSVWIRHNGTEVTETTDGLVVDTATEPDEPDEPDDDTP